LKEARVIRIVVRASRIFAVALAIAACSVVAQAQTAGGAAFQQWLQTIWPEAQKLGVSRKTFDEATRGLEPDFSLPDLVLPGRPERQPDQAEFVQTPADYLKEASLARLADQGRKLLNEHRAALAKIEQQFGVPPSIVLAIWGRETAFGNARLPHDAIRVLATQAYTGRRKDMFRGEFLAALKMLQDGLVKRADMKSSWGGAMGLTQFLPSEFYKHAVDFDNDGRADIFRSVPDALASAAKQLANKGWQRGVRWAYEVKAPPRFDCTQAVPEVQNPIYGWIKGGFAPVTTQKLSNAEGAETASVLQPEGSLGPSFLTTKNYFVIKDYNFSDLYVLFVGNLADRIAGGSGFVQPWGKSEQMKTAQVEEMQRIMTARGLYKDKIDGKAGMLTRAALGAYQKANRLKVDCWPHVSVLEHMQRRIDAR
jgi:lytic murein transglycosylase